MYVCINLLRFVYEFLLLTFLHPLFLPTLPLSSGPRLPSLLSQLSPRLSLSSSGSFPTTLVTAQSLPALSFLNCCFLPSLPLFALPPRLLGLAPFFPLTHLPLSSPLVLPLPPIFSWLPLLLRLPVSGIVAGPGYLPSPPLFLSPKCFCPLPIKAATLQIRFVSSSKAFPSSSLFQFFPHSLSRRCFLNLFFFLPNLPLKFPSFPNNTPTLIN